MSLCALLSQDLGGFLYSCHGVNSLLMFILSVNSDKVTKQLYSHKLSFNNLCHLSECIRPLQIFTDKLLVFMN